MRVFQTRDGSSILPTRTSFYQLSESKVDKSCTDKRIEVKGVRYFAVEAKYMLNPNEPAKTKAHTA